MVFCFPCKSLGKNFKEDNEPPKPKPESNGKKEDGKEEAKPAAPAAAPAAAATTAETKEGPRVAIIIYSMYGHIATRKSLQSFNFHKCVLTLTPYHSSG